MLYETKAKVHRLAPTGEDKEVREHFIMNAESFAEAELRTLTEYSNVGEEADVFAIFRSNVYEIVNDKEEDKPYFLATVTDTVIDENNGNEKEMKYQMLVCAKDVTEQQQIYAALDAWACLRLYKYIRSGQFRPAESPFYHLVSDEPVAALPAHNPS